MPVAAPTTAAPPAPVDPPTFGHLDLAVPRTLHAASDVVSGWALDAAGVAAVELVAGDGTRWPLRFGVARADVAAVHGGYPDSSHAGFEDESGVSESGVASARQAPEDPWVPVTDEAPLRVRRRGPEGIHLPLRWPPGIAPRELGRELVLSASAGSLGLDTSCSTRASSGRPRRSSHFLRGARAGWRHINAVARIAGSQPATGDTRRMSVQLSVDPTSGTVLVTAEGPLGASDVLEALAGVWQTPAFHEHARVLWDLRKADAAGLDTAALRRIALFEEKGRPAMPPARLAFLVERDVEFGLARMVGVFTDDDRIEQQVFRDESAARAWLVR